MKSILYRTREHAEDALEYTLSPEAQTIVVIRAEDYTSESQAMIGKLFGALNLTLDKDITTVQVLKDEFSLNDLIDDARVKYLITFGFKPQELGWNVEGSKYHLHRFESFTWLPGDSLTTIAQDKNHKQQLWSAIKDLYNKP